MLNKRVFAAAVLSVSLVAPFVSPLSQAQTSVLQSDEARAAHESSVTRADPIKAGAKTITGRIGLRNPGETVKIKALFLNQVHTEPTTVSKSASEVPELVEFLIKVPDLQVLKEGDKVQIGPEGEPSRQVVVTVQPADAQGDGNPAPAPSPAPGVNTPNPGGTTKPGPGQSTPMPLPKPENNKPETTPKGPQEPGEKDNLPKGPKAPENEGQKPGEEKKPEAPNAPDDKDKKPEAPKKPGKEPKDPQVPGGEGKKPEVDKDALQGSSNIGDFFKTLAALGGVAGIVSGIVNLFSQGSSGANFLQPLRDFLAQFNSKF